MKIYVFIFTIKVRITTIINHPYFNAYQKNLTLVKHVTCVTLIYYNNLKTYKTNGKLCVLIIVDDRFVFTYIRVLPISIIARIVVKGIFSTHALSMERTIVTI